MLTAGEQKYVN
jgi:hypothetical protein